MDTPELRLIEPTDHKAFFTLIDNNRERLVRYFPITISKTQSIEATKQFLKDLEKKIDKKEFYPFGMFNGNELLGVVFLKNIDWRIPKGELGYYIDKIHEGKGIMSIIVNNTITFCFEELKIRKLVLRIAPENMGSKRIATKLGFEKEGLLRKEWRTETGELEDMEYYGKLKD